MSTRTVRLAEGWSLFVRGELRTEGDEVEVEEALAEEWQAAGYVEPVPPKRRRSQ